MLMGKFVSGCLPVSCDTYCILDCNVYINILIQIIQVLDYKKIKKKNAFMEGHGHQFSVCYPRANQCKATATYFVCVCHNVYLHVEKEERDGKK